MKRPETLRISLREWAWLLFSCAVGYGVFLAASIPSREENRAKLVVGGRFSYGPNADLFAEFKGTRHVILAVASECPFSVQSRAFHERLISRSGQTGVRALVVSENPSQTDFGSTQSAKVGHLRNLGIRSKPTIALIEGDGLISGLWTGKLSSAYEDAVLKRIAGSGHIVEDEGGVTVLSQSGYEKLLGTSVPLNPARRGFVSPSPIPGSISIPHSELIPRAVAEIPRSARVVVDCSNVTAGVCELARDALKSASFHRVTLLDKGIMGASCESTAVR